VDKVLTALRDSWHIQVQVEPVRTSLRETFVRHTKAQGRLVKQSGGHGQYAVCMMEIEPLARGAGFEFTERVVGGAVPRQFIPSVEKGIRSQLAKGVLAGYPLVDLRVTLVDGKAHSVDSSDMAFQTAGAMALREAANESTVALLEPIHGRRRLGRGRHGGSTWSPRPGARHGNGPEPTRLRRDSR
jgi:elongation factor G